MVLLVWISVMQSQQCNIKFDLLFMLFRAWNNSVLDWDFLCFLLLRLILTQSPPGSSLVPCCSLDIQGTSRASLFLWVGVNGGQRLKPFGRQEKDPCTPAHLILNSSAPTFSLHHFLWTPVRVKYWWIDPHLNWGPQTALQGARTKKKGDE